MKKKSYNSNDSNVYTHTNTFVTFDPASGTNATLSRLPAFLLRQVTAPQKGQSRGQHYKNSLL